MLCIDVGGMLVLLMGDIEVGVECWLVVDVCDVLVV